MPHAVAVVREVLCSVLQQPLIFDTQYAFLSHFQGRWFV